ncbi:hypothetical protein M378DRAFT_15973 [Amanita muscaria Koide BX008]|uniref:Uncharacterized protein n=1 Tax=Amanita muscaria (strain Koide BX008) TaxID=946122 RepID=A0A0C2WNR0_AMAMK|nr:hypothetical protein M378DRAFT_15973 [Amanita muscaria Koide BX008]
MLTPHIFTLPIWLNKADHFVLEERAGGGFDDAGHLRLLLDGVTATSFTSAMLGIKAEGPVLIDTGIEQSKVSVASVGETANGLHHSSVYLCQLKDPRTLARPTTSLYFLSINSTISSRILQTTSPSRANIFGILTCLPLRLGL